MKNEFTFLSNDSITTIHAYMWIPETPVKALFQIAHGKGEFAERYDEFASFLCDNGILVVANDHLGHGKSVANKSCFGHFAVSNDNLHFGNDVLLKDMNYIHEMFQKKYPDAPYFILGHSMGSWLLRQYLYTYKTRLNGAVIVATGSKNIPETLGNMTVCSTLAQKYGWEMRCAIPGRLAFGNLNERFGAPDGKECLSRNPENVKSYENEPLCQYDFDLNGYYNFFYSQSESERMDNLSKMDKNIPVLITAGSDDPVGDYSKGPETVFRKFKDAGMKNVSIKLYPEDRHEILNEIDRVLVYSDILKFILP